MWESSIVLFFQVDVEFKLCLIRLCFNAPSSFIHYWTVLTWSVLHPCGVIFLDPSPTSCSSPHSPTPPLLPCYTRNPWPLTIPPSVPQTSLPPNSLSPSLLPPNPVHSTVKNPICSR